MPEWHSQSWLCAFYRKKNKSSEQILLDFYGTMRYPSTRRKLRPARSNPKHSSNIDTDEHNSVRAFLRHAKTGKKGVNCIIN